MTVSTLTTAILLAIQTAQSQQFDGYTFPHDLLGMSSGCFATVNKTVSSCPAWLPRYAGLDGAAVEILPSEQLTALCESSCQSDLKSLRSSIMSSCTASSDVMVPNKVAYPATFLVDRFLYAAGLSCLKDKATGKYCDAVVADWVNQDNYTATQICSQCQLGAQQLQLGSPFGFTDTLAQAFGNTTKSCSATSYSYAMPTSYALNATAIPPPPACVGSAYALKQNDTCVTVSVANNISTYSLINKNSLNLGCDNLPEIGQSLCLPANSTCRTYQLNLYETCQDLMTNWNATLAQVQSWNPMINSACSNLASWRGWYLCSSSPSGTAAVASGNTVTTAAPVPTNAQPQSKTKCGQWYFVKAGDTCSAISLKFSISLSDFYFLNPQVDSSCSNLWADTSYCVKPVGNIETYSGYTTTTAATSFTRPVTSTDFVPSPVATAAFQPTASGTISGCFVYENAFDATSRLNLTVANTCSSWANLYRTTVDQLIEWNPSLSATSCSLVAGKSYCLQKSQDPPNATLPYDYCVTANRTRIPSPSVSPSVCACYTNFRIQDKPNFNCSMAPTLFNITVSELTNLNPWIGASCDTGIWSQMTNDGYEQVCVLRSSARPTSSSAVPTTTTSSQSATSSGPPPPAPTQPGASSKCQIWHTVVSGDTCYDIANVAAITLGEFYRMNPGVRSDCSALWLGYAVCIGE